MSQGGRRDLDRIAATTLEQERGRGVMMSSSKGQGCAECEEKESGEKGKGPRFCGGFIAVCIELRRKKEIREGISYFRLAQWLGPLGDSLLCFASLSSLGSQNCQNLGYTLYQPTRYRNDDATYAMHTAIYSNAPVLLPPLAHTSPNFRSIPNLNILSTSLPCASRPASFSKPSSPCLQSHPFFMPCDASLSPSLSSSSSSRIII